MCGLSTMRTGREAKHHPGWQRDRDIQRAKIPSQIDASDLAQMSHTLHPDHSKAFTTTHPEDISLACGDEELQMSLPKTTVVV
jgi:hypothetical protein